MPKKQFSSLTHGIPSIFLTSHEVKELTHYIHKYAQARALHQMGIEHKVRPDGSIAVLRSHVEQILSGEVSKIVIKKIEPHWGAIINAT